MGDVAKNYRNSGYKRNELDKYYTPEGFIDVLAQHYRPIGLVHECCYGGGDLARQINNKWSNSIGYTSDIDTGEDFFKFKKRPVDCLITNPPFSQLYGKRDIKAAEKFIRHAINLQYDEHVWLLSSDWDFAGGRSDLFSFESQFYMKIAINKRYKWIENSKSGGMHNFAWYIFKKDAIGKEPLMRYGPK